MPFVDRSIELKIGVALAMLERLDKLSEGAKTFFKLYEPDKGEESFSLRVRSPSHRQKTS